MKIIFLFALLVTGQAYGEVTYYNCNDEVNSVQIIYIDNQTEGWRNGLFWFSAYDELRLKSFEIFVKELDLETQYPGEEHLISSLEVCEGNREGCAYDGYHTYDETRQRGLIWRTGWWEGGSQDMYTFALADYPRIESNFGIKKSCGDDIVFVSHELLDKNQNVIHEFTVETSMKNCEVIVTP